MIQKIRRFSAAIVLIIAPLLTVLAPGVAHASGNNCLWNGSSSASFNTAANWSNCASSTPGTGDNLIFDNTSIPGSGANLVDNISGITFANVTFQGSGSAGYVIGTVSSTLTLSGNITDTTSNPTGGATIDVPITLTGATPTITVGNTLDLLGASNNLTIGSNTLTFTGAGIVTSDFPIIGTGTVNFSLASASEFDQNSPSPSFTGQVNVTSGVLDLDSNADPYPDYFGSATGITVTNGATVFFSDPAVTSATINEPITAGGDGATSCTDTFSDASFVDCGAIEGGLAFGGNLTLAGAVTLTANSQFNDNDTMTLTGALSGDFTVENAVGNLVISSSANTSATPNGTYGAGGDLQTGSGASSGAAAPKTPDTGLAATLMANPLTTVIVTLLTTATLLAIIRYRSSSAIGRN